SSGATVFRCRTEDLADVTDRKQFFRIFHFFPIRTSAHQTQRTRPTAARSITSNRAMTDLCRGIRKNLLAGPNTGIIERLNSPGMDRRRPVAIEAGGSTSNTLMKQFQLLGRTCSRVRALLWSGTLEVKSGARWNLLAATILTGAA